MNQKEIKKIKELKIKTNTKIKKLKQTKLMDTSLLTMYHQGFYDALDEILRISKRKK